MVTLLLKLFLFYSFLIQDCFSSLKQELEWLILLRKLWLVKMECFVFIFLYIHFSLVLQPITRNRSPSPLPLCTALLGCVYTSGFVLSFCACLSAWFLPDAFELISCESIYPFTESPLQVQVLLSKQKAAFEISNGCSTLFSFSVRSLSIKSFLTAVMLQQ